MTAPTANRTPVDREVFEAALQLEASGRLAEAEAAYRRILAESGGHAVVTFNLGNVLMRQGRVADAAAAYREAATAKPEQPAFWFNLGNCRLQLGRWEAAAESLERALALAPREPAILLNLSDAYRQLRREDEGLDCLRRAAEIAPDNTAVISGLAHNLHRMGHRQEAIAAFGRLTVLDPDDATARHLLAALTGESRDQAPRDHVITTFDGMADDYDRHLIGELAYAGPELIHRALAGHLPPGTLLANALDLGCGTGLSGQILRPLVRRLEGVDLAPAMVARAREKGLYDHLAVADIVAYMAAAGRAYDLVAAADVFTYIGDLAPVFAAASACITPGGWFTFTTEFMADGRFKLRPSGRYGHSEAYVARLAGRHGFAVVTCGKVDLRKERGHWVAGLLWLLQRGHELKADG